MINLRMTDNREDIRKWTGLSSENHDMALWEAGFNLDDWDVCFESDTRLCQPCEELDEDGFPLYEPEPIAEAGWLVRRMDEYYVGFDEVEYNGKWYYTVHHA